MTASRCGADRRGAGLLPEHGPARDGRPQERPRLRAREALPGPYRPLVATTSRSSAGQQTRPRHRDDPGAGRPLTFMSTEARLKCPFMSLGVAPEAASSVTFPTLMGGQASLGADGLEWIRRRGLRALGSRLAGLPARQAMATTMEHAQVLASKPISSLTVKRLMGVPTGRPSPARRKRARPSST